MKLLSKVAIAALVAGIGAATMYAAPGGATGSLDDLVTQAVTIRARINEDFQHVLHLRQIAKKEKDVIKLNCVNDRLVQMKPEMNLADQAYTEFQGALEISQRQASLGVLVGQSEAIHRDREAADQCIGEKLMLSESANDYTHPDIPDDPGVDPFGGAIEPPAYASPPGT